MNIPIVFSTDHNYVMPCGVTILSLLQSAVTSTYSIHVLVSKDVTEEDKEMIRRQVEKAGHGTVGFVDMEDSFAGSLEIRGISIACYYRLLIPWLLPQYEKVIYSDVDIIFHEDLEKIYSPGLEDNYVAGVNTPGFISKKSYRKHIVKLGLDPDKYINSGLLVINSELQRRDGLNSRYLELSERKLLFQDQDIINMVCKGRIRHLERRYNMLPEKITPTMAFLSNDAQPSCGKTGNVEKNNTNSGKVAVVHYTGPKPWKTFTFGWLEWWDLYRQSIFFNYEFYLKISRRALDKKGILLGFVKTKVEQIIKL